MSNVRAVAAAMKSNLGPGQPGLDWWGKVTAVAAGPPPTVAVSLRGLTGSVITCKVGSAYLAQVPAVGDTVFGRQDQRGDYWCVDRIASTSTSSSPRGSLAHGIATAGTGTISASTQIAGVQASGTLLVGRWYRVRGSCLMQCVTAGIMQAGIYAGAGATLLRLFYAEAIAGDYRTMSPVWEAKCVASPSGEGQIAAGAMTFTLQVLTNGGTAQALYSSGGAYNAEITLEDIGANF